MAQNECLEMKIGHRTQKENESLEDYVENYETMKQFIHEHRVLIIKIPIMKYHLEKYTVFMAPIKLKVAFRATYMKLKTR